MSSTNASVTPRTTSKVHKAAGFAKKTAASANKATAPIKARLNYLLAKSSIASDRTAGRPITKLIIADDGGVMSDSWIPVYEKLARQGYAVRVKPRLASWITEEVLVTSGPDSYGGTLPGQVRVVDAVNQTREILFDFSDMFDMPDIADDDYSDD